MSIKALVIRASSSLRVRLLVLVLLALLPGLFLLLAIASGQRRQAALDARESAMRLTRSTAASQAQLVQSAHYLLITLAQLPAIRNHDQVGCTTFLKELVAQYPAYANFGAVDRDGNIWCMGLPLNQSVNVSDRSYFKQAMATRDFGVGEYQISRANRKAVITFGYPILDPEGVPQGIVFAGLDLHWLNLFIATSNLPAGATVAVIDRNGTYLARYPGSDEWLGQPMRETSIAETIRASGDGTMEATDAGGVARLYAFTPLLANGGAGIYAMVSLPQQVAFENADATLRLDVAALAVGALLALLAAWKASDWFVLRQVNGLLTATRRVSAGDLTVRTGKTDSGGELGQLAHAFDEMTATVEQREREQQQTLEQIQRAQDQIQRQSRRAEALARIANQLNAHLDLESVLKAVCEETSRALGAPSVTVRLYDPESDAFCYAAGCGIPTSDRDHWQPLARTQFDEFAARYGRVVVISDPSAIPGLPNGALLARMGVQTLVTAGMQHEQKLVGVLSLFTLVPREFSEEELVFLQGIADQAALAIAKARLYAALKSEERTRANLLHKVITAQEDERMRIARELHDETGQSLTALMLGMDVVRIALAENPAQAEKHLQDIRAVAEGMLTNIHRLIADLRPALLDDLGLLPAIAWYGEQRLNPLGITMRVEGDGVKRRLPRAIETALFRIAQEGVTNIVRYAHASNVTARLAREDGHLSLCLSDDGCGFDPQVLYTHDPKGKGLGLRGMQERATILGGEFHLRTAPGKGTTVTVRVPVPEE